MYKILSLDGGGVRGILTITVIERLLAKHPNFLQSVDLIAGTSIGGIIALALAHGKTPTDIKNTLYQSVSKVFDDSWMHNLQDLGGLTGADYDNEELKNLLSQIFAKTTMGQLTKKVVIPAFNLDNKNPKARSWEAKIHHNFEGSEDNNLTLSEVALRTSAAPTYFPTAGTYIDGGIVAGDPSMVALAKAQDLPVAINDITILSIGTGKSLTYIKGKDLDWGDLKWVQPIIQILLDANMGIAEWQCSKLLKSKFFRISPIFNKDVSIPLDDWKRRDELIRIGQEYILDSADTWIEQNWK